MELFRDEDGRIVSEWDPPEVPPQIYAGCLYCSAPVDVSNIVNRAVADALFAVSAAIEGGVDPKDVVAACDRVGSELYELVRFQDDDSIAVAALRKLSLDTSGKKGEKADVAKNRRGRPARGTS